MWWVSCKFEFDPQSHDTPWIQAVLNTHILQVDLVSWSDWKKVEDDQISQRRWASSLPMKSFARLGMGVKSPEAMFCWYKDMKCRTKIEMGPEPTQEDKVTFQRTCWAVATTHVGTLSRLKTRTKWKLSSAFFASDDLRAVRLRWE